MGSMLSWGALPKSWLRNLQLSEPVKGHSAGSHGTQQKASISAQPFVAYLEHASRFFKGRTTCVNWALPRFVHALWAHKPNVVGSGSGFSIRNMTMTTRRQNGQASLWFPVKPRTNWLTVSQWISVASCHSSKETIIEPNIFF